MVDTCVWIGPGEDVEAAAFRQLQDYRKEWRVELGKSDTVDTERTEGQSGTVAAGRIEETAGVIEVLGPAIVGHSRVGHSVWAGEEDGERIDLVVAALFPNGNRHGQNQTDRHNLRDAMHVATAIRYGWDGFVTTDHAVLAAAQRVRAGWQIEILRPTEAVAWVDRLIAKEDRRAQRRRA
jgi:hypothetical protein